MTKDNRSTMPPIPDELEHILNPQQIMTLRDAENEGWELCFVRREGLEVPLPVIKGADDQIFAVIEEDGKFNGAAEIKVRNNPRDPA